MDVSGIRAGADFANVIRREVVRCNVLVALIGPKWNEVDAQGRRRLDDPDDFVRIEIASALADGKPVIPVLLDGAPFPTEASLPEDVQSLTRFQAMRLTHENFRPECLQLVEHIQVALVMQPRFRL